jgi:hypothetical protein
MGRRSIWAVVLGMVLATACVPPAPPREQIGPPILVTDASWEEAQAAVRFPVPRAGYLPPGSQFQALDYSAHPRHEWVAQRYVVGDAVVYILGERLSPPQLGLDAVRQVTVQGRPAFIYSRPRVDGGVADWRVVWQKGPVLYTVGGVLPAERLVEIAAQVR